MKAGLFNKRNIIIVCVLLSFLLTGYVFKKVVLKNANEPFIDLSSSIGTSIGNAELEDTIEHPVVSMENTKPEPTPTPIPNSGQPKEIEIRIMGEEVKMDGNTYTDIGIFEKKIRSSTYDGEEKAFILIDAFAETTVYKSVKGILDSTGKKYKEEQE